MLVPDIRDSCLGLLLSFCSFLQRLFLTCRPSTVSDLRPCHCDHASLALAQMLLLRSISLSGSEFHEIVSAGRHGDLFAEYRPAARLAADDVWW